MTPEVWRLKLALSIVSGRRTEISQVEYTILFGVPGNASLTSLDALRDAAEEVIIDSITNRANDYGQAGQG